jgi:hypothetical protein
LQLRVPRLGFLEDVKWAIYPEKYRDLRKWSELSGDATTPKTIPASPPIPIQRLPNITANISTVATDPIVSNTSVQPRVRLVAMM